MAFWMFWSSEALDERIMEVLMEHSKNSANAHEISDYSYFSFRDKEQENGDIVLEMQELRRQMQTLSDKTCELSSQVDALSNENLTLSAEVRSLRSELDGMKRVRTPDVNVNTGAKATPSRESVERTSVQPKSGWPWSVQRSAILFRENAGNDDRVLRKFSDEAKRLKRTAERNLSANGEEKAFCLNLIEQCIRGFTALEAKSADFDAADLAEESVKILKKTVCKALAKSELKPDIERYLETCGVKNMGWGVGKKLSDDEYACLEEPVFYDEVETPRKDGMITKVERDSYYIAYEEDGLIRKALIPGTYHIGKFRGRKP